MRCQSVEAVDGMRNDEIAKPRDPQQVCIFRQTTTTVDSVNAAFSVFKSRIFPATLGNRNVNSFPCIRASCRLLQFTLTSGGATRFSTAVSLLPRATIGHGVNCSHAGRHDATVSYVVSSESHHVGQPRKIDVGEFSDAHHGWHWICGSSGNPCGMGKSIRLYPSQSSEQSPVADWWDSAS